MYFEQSLKNEWRFELCPLSRKHAVSINALIAVLRPFQCPASQCRKSSTMKTRLIPVVCDVCTQSNIPDVRLKKKYKRRTKTSYSDIVYTLYRADSSVYCIERRNIGEAELWFWPIRDLWQQQHRGLSRNDHVSAGPHSVGALGP